MNGRAGTGCLLFTALIWNVFFFSQPCFGEQTLRFAGVENVYPFAYLENGVAKGYDVDIFREMMKRANVRVDIELLPFKRLYRYLEDGVLDGTFMIYFIKERESKVMYSLVPMHTFSYHIFVKKGQEFPFESLKDIYGKKVANQAGFSISPEFDAAVKAGSVTLDEALSIEMNLKKLMSGRVDCYISSARLIRRYTDDLGITDQISKLPNPIVKEKRLYMALSLSAKGIKDKKALIKLLSKIRNEMDRDGTIDAIDSRYFK
jgi:polar amino acid transport system substrate-binding protein